MFRIFLILATLFSQSIFANNYLDNLNTLVFDSKSEAAKKIEVGASIGYGQYISSLSFENKDQKAVEGITNTNQKYYNFGLELNDFDLQTKLQYNDPSESLKSRVDTRFESYQLSYKASEKMKFEIYYQNIKSFYLENRTTLGITEKFNNVSILRSGILFNYLTNEKHKSPSIDSIVYKRSDWSSSWIFGAGINNFKIDGLSDFDPILNPDSGDQILSSKAIGIDGRIAGSTLWHGKNWFAGGSLGLAYSINQYKNRGPQTVSTETKNSVNSQVTLSAGYIWKKFLIGSYISINSFNYEIQKYQIRYASGASVLYASYQF